MTTGRRPVLVLTAPTYLWLTVAIFLPLAAMAYFSVLTDAPFGAGPPPTLTLDNYAAAVGQDLYRTLALRSLELGFDTTLVCLLVGFPAALALARAVPGRWREAVFLLVVLPFWTNALVRAFSWTMVLRPNGLVDVGLSSTLPGWDGLDILYSYPAVVIGLVHAYLPYMILTCYLALQAIDDSLIDAARSLGAGNLQILWRVLLPLSLPGMVAGSVLIFVPVIGSFMEPRILGGANAPVLGTVIEEQFTAVFNWPLGAALSFVLLGAVVVIMALFTPVLRGRLGDGG